MQKCDARRPCAACTLARRTSLCVYDDEKNPQSVGVYPSHGTDDHVSGQNRGGAELVDTPTVVPARSTAEPNPVLSTSYATHVVTHGLSALQTFNARQVPHGRSSGFVVRRNSFKPYVSLDSDPSISFISSFLHPAIPPEPRIPLSFLGKEKLQVQTSETVTTDLDMRSYVLK